ncbi:Asp/Glu racemase [Kribbella shirazensis]|uniref:Maleate isomerase n=1 Tax=Kribbella shirazensis TaxID=1105143 RepID=A0A7X5VG43_9ACTN|nr:Asp/Glu racemase [Kribbella shirazensis]NIK60583.1 maleate isomerase [Kribbella shirazensis]
MSTRPITHPMPAAVPPLLQTGIGVVAPYDFALDRELWRWAPDDVTLHFTRTPYAPMAATVEMAVHISDPELIARTTYDVLAVAPLAVAYACTFGSFVGGLTGEHALVDAMVGAGAPAAVTTSGALLLALRRLGVNRIATVTPYTNDLTAGLTSFLTEAGVEVVATAGLGLIAQIWAVPYETTVELVQSVDSAAAEAIFISCTNLPTYDVIAGLEAALGKPVLTANQVTMWAVLELTGHTGIGPGQRLMSVR